ncbi:hypothetical protein ES703_96405 [subsurface metagenome]
MIDKRKCEYCHKTIKKPRKDSVTCGRKKCKKEYNREYNKSENFKSYNKDYQKITQRALWELVQRHKKEFRKIRNKLWERKNGK